MVNRFPAAQEFVSLRDAMDRLLQDSFVGSFAGGPFRTLWSASGTTGGAARMPLPLDVYATTDEVVVIAAAPGLGPDDLQIAYDRGTLTLTGQTPNVADSGEAKGATWYLHELPHGTFVRSVGLPIEVDPDRAEATFEHGILRLRLPKAEQARPRRIQVRAGAGAPASAVAATAGNGAEAAPSEG